MNRLVLWDIDRTLVTIAGVSVGLFATALKAVTGRKLEQMPDLAGKTDRELIATVLELHGVPFEATLFEPFYLALAAAAVERKVEMQAKGRALPGASAALVALGAVPGVVQSVVTGNIAPIARQKLSLFGLAALIDFEIGGYGSESANRTEIVGLARERAASKYGQNLPGGSVVVIGDTTLDIRGALGSGVVAVGVATGSNSADELRAAGAHVVLGSLVDTSAVVAAVLNSATESEQQSVNLSRNSRAAGTKVCIWHGSLTSPA